LGKTPAKGKAAKGIKEVAGKGTGSKIHHRPTHSVILAVAAAACGKPNHPVITNISSPNKGPMRSKAVRVCLRFIIVSFDYIS